jgi:hypothetical protein
VAAAVAAASPVAIGAALAPGIVLAHQRLAFRIVLEEILPMSRALAALVLSAATLGCGQPTSSQTTSASASAAPAPPSAATVAASSSAEAEDTGPVWLGLKQRNEEQVAKVINPKNQAPYAGKTATVRGTIRIEGDEPPDTTLTLPAECTKAASVYQKLFRKGPKGELADAMVAVTRYDGFVPATKRAVEVTIEGCAFSTRTVVAAYGQRIEARNVDKTLSFMPYLDGAPFRAMMVAVPGGNPVKMYPTEPKARYLLRDMMNHPFMLAEVFVVNYATTDVTDVDGTYEIRGIPVGKARIDVLLPLINKASGQDLELVEGDNTVDLTLKYDKKTDIPSKVPPPIWGDRDPARGVDVVPVAPSASSAPR